MKEARKHCIFCVLKGAICETLHFSALFLKIFVKKFGSLKFVRTFAIPNNKRGKQNAEVAQLVEHNLAKVGVASSSLVFCSKTKLRVIFG